MMTLTTNTEKTCDFCTHAAVCKYSENFLKNLNEAKSRSSDLSPLSITYSCKYFLASYTTIKQIDPIPKYLDTTYLDSSDDPCLTCPSYIRLKSGETYVGDSPCQWCSHNKARVTCSNTSQGIIG